VELREQFPTCQRTAGCSESVSANDNLKYLFTCISLREVTEQQNRMLEIGKPVSQRDGEGTSGME
jgi:hypothetical protein